MKKIFSAIVLSLFAAAAAAQGLYVATDKSCYVAGDTAGCSAFCSPGASVAYIELVSSQGSAARTKLALSNGRGAGTISIPLDAPTGNYRLVSYLPGQTPDPSSGPVISIFNTLSTDRVNDGVEIVQKASRTASVSQSGYGFAADIHGDSLIVRNISGRPVSYCISLYRDDSLQSSERSRSIASFKPSGAGAPSFGEIISGWVLGADSACAGSVILAVPGSRTDCYQCPVQADGSFAVQTENIYGDVDLVCIPVGADNTKDCFVALDSPFRCPPAEGLPKLEIFRSMENDLLRRSAEMQRKAAADTLAVSLPVRGEHFFLEHECTAYILDDYTRFPTMQEVFVELIPNARMQRRGGSVSVQVLMETSVMDASPRWGSAVVMIDGVPVPDGRLVESYDPALIKVLEVYPYKYKIGDTEFDGVVNLVTFKGNMPGLLFDDFVRIYSFNGCSFPVILSGSETLSWLPLEELPAGGSTSVDCSPTQKGAIYTLNVEGITDQGRAVYFRKTFSR
ncbi:MAG: hypothetical protein J6O51_03145 [Bacteroidales bacterium]|nr:hypothetical protein [Bacteroidales bacterium]